MFYHRKANNLLKPKIACNSLLLYFLICIILYILEKCLYFIFNKIT